PTVTRFAPIDPDLRLHRQLARAQRLLGLARQARGRALEPALVAAEEILGGQRELLLEPEAHRLALADRQDALGVLALVPEPDAKLAAEEAGLLDTGEPSHQRFSVWKSSGSRAGIAASSFSGKPRCSAATYAPSGTSSSSKVFSKSSIR